MATLTLDCITAAEEVWEGNALMRAVRRAVVSGVDVQAGGNGRDPLVMQKAKSIGGMPQKGDGHPADAACFVQELHVRATANDQCEVLIRYARPSQDFSGPINTFYIRDATSVVSESTQLMPNTRKPIRVTYSIDGTTEINKSATLQFLVPHRQIVVTGMADVSRISLIRASVGMVNANPWLGLGRAYWLFAGLDTVVGSYDFGSPSGTRWSVQATFITKNHEDWSSYALATYPTGDYVPISEGLVNDIRGTTYQPNFIVRGNGIIRAMMYPVIDFGSVFSGIT